MSPSASTPRPRTVSRPAAPRCRGGASSVLRLGKPGAYLGASVELPGWIERAAAAIKAQASSDNGPSIITRLAPSTELAAR